MNPDYNNMFPYRNLRYNYAREFYELIPIITDLVFPCHKEIFFGTVLLNDNNNNNEKEIKIENKHKDLFEDFYPGFEEDLLSSNSMTQTMPENNNINKCERLSPSPQPYGLLDTSNFWEDGQDDSRKTAPFFGDLIDIDWGLEPDVGKLSVEDQIVISLSSEGLVEYARMAHGIDFRWILRLLEDDDDEGELKCDDDDTSFYTVDEGYSDCSFDEFLESETSLRSCSEDFPKLPIVSILLSTSSEKEI